MSRLIAQGFQFHATFLRETRARLGNGSPVAAAGGIDAELHSLKITILGAAVRAHHHAADRDPEKLFGWTTR